jgi:hypothetical protein
MNGLADCASRVRCEGRRWTGDLQERKGGVTLQVDGDRPFALHLLDDARIAMAGKRCDGVLIAETSGPGLVCFLELKGTIEVDQADQPFEQIQGAVEHFAVSKPHGRRHHDRWRDGEDLPTYPRGRGAPRPLGVEADHSVGGAVIVVRGGTRVLPRIVEVGGRSIFVAVLQRHGARGRVMMALEELEDVLMLSAGR